MDKQNKIRMTLTIDPAILQAAKARSDATSVSVSAAAERLLEWWAAGGALPDRPANGGSEASGPAAPDPRKPSRGAARRAKTRADALARMGAVSQRRQAKRSEKIRARLASLPAADSEA